MSNQRRDSLRALGVTLIDCVVCGNAFSVLRYPRHWCALNDAREEVVAGGAEQVFDEWLLCSEECAEKRKEQSNREYSTEGAAWYVYAEPDSDE
jgi:predicted nucleic acid-binding Zn ribbon protein